MHCHSAHQFVLTLPMNPASHLGLPGANNVYIPRYDQLSITGQSPEAANITANFLSISEPTICTLTYAVAHHWTNTDTTSPVAEISDCQVITTHISVDEGPLIHVATSANDTNLAAFELECPIQPLALTATPVSLSKTAMTCSRSLDWTTLRPPNYSLSRHERTRCQGSLFPIQT